MCMGVYGLYAMGAKVGLKTPVDELAKLFVDQQIEIAVEGVAFYSDLIQSYPLVSVLVFLVIGFVLGMDKSNSSDGDYESYSGGGNMVSIEGSGWCTGLMTKKE